MDPLKRLFYLLMSLVLTMGSSCDRNPKSEEPKESTLVQNDSFPERDSVQIVTAWLKRNAIPIKFLEAGNDFSDLEPLKETLKDVKVIGLGESTHGTREFFQLKHRLLEFLVTEMNFTDFVIESSYSACQPINDYILTGKGDRATVLTGQGYTAWDTEEFSAMLDWMRVYNQKVPDGKKLKFHGNDLCFNGIGREKVLAFLGKYANEKLPAAEALFKTLSAEEDKWPARLDQSVLQQAFIPLQELIIYLSTNKHTLVAKSSAVEWENVYKHAQIMGQWVLANLHETPPSLSLEKLGRIQYMGENLLYLIEKEKPDTKFIVWAHDYHIESNAHTEDINGEATLGYKLRQKFGDSYYALGFKCGQGTFQARELLPENIWGDLKADTILPVQKSVTWYLRGIGMGNLFVDLRATSTHNVVDKWLETPIIFGAGHWISRSAKENYEREKLRGIYDGLVFIENSTPVRPTKNALFRSENRIGF